MSKPYVLKLQEGLSVWNMDDLKKHQNKLREEEIQMLQEQAANRVMGDRGQNGRVVLEEDIDGMEYELEEADEDAIMELDI